MQFWEKSTPDMIGALVLSTDFAHNSQSEKAYKGQNFRDLSVELNDFMNLVFLHLKALKFERYFDSLSQISTPNPNVSASIQGQ